MFHEIQYRNCERRVAGHWHDSVFFPIQCNDTPATRFKFGGTGNGRRSLRLRPDEAPPGRLGRERTLLLEMMRLLRNRFDYSTSTVQLHTCPIGNEKHSKTTVTVLIAGKPRWLLPVLLFSGCCDRNASVVACTVLYRVLCGR